MMPIDRLPRLARIVAGGLALVATSAFAQAGGSEARPNFSGIWQALNTANWELEAHAAEPGPPCR